MRGSSDPIILGGLDLGNMSHSWFLVLRFRFQEKGFVVRPLRPLHVDLRGKSSGVLVDEVELRENWLH